MKKILSIVLIVFLIFVVGGVIIIHSLPQKIAVLTYHDFTEENSVSMKLNIEEFKQQMNYLKKHNYHTLTLEEIECFMNNSCQIPKKSVLLTFDDGWKSFITVAAPILKENDFHATIFYLGKNYDGNNPSFMDMDDLNELKENYPNIEIASHTYNLHEEEAYLLSKDELESDMEEMKKIVSSSYFAYPYGKHSEDYHEALKEEGYKLAFTFGPDVEHRKLSREDDLYQLPRLNMSDGMPFWKFVLRLNWFK